MFNFDLIVGKTNNYSSSSLHSLWFIPWTKVGVGALCEAEAETGNFRATTPYTMTLQHRKPAVKGGWVHMHIPLSLIPRILGCSMNLEVSEFRCHLSSGMSVQVSVEGRWGSEFKRCLSFWDSLWFFGFTEPRASFMLNAYSLPLSCSLGHTWPTSFSPSFINPK